jgi:hypothetical protein
MEAYTMSFPGNEPLPIACTLSTDARAARTSAIDHLFQQAVHIQDLDDGYALAFPADDEWARTLFDFIVAERACCAFFTFTLTFPAPHDAIWLSLRGANGVKEMLSVTFANLRAG